MWSYQVVHCWSKVWTGLWYLHLLTGLLHQDPWDSYATPVFNELFQRITFHICVVKSETCKFVIATSPLYNPHTANKQTLTLNRNRKAHCRFLYVGCWCFLTIILMYLLNSGYLLLHSKHNYHITAVMGTSDESYSCRSSLDTNDIWRSISKFLTSS